MTGGDTEAGRRAEPDSDVDPWWDIQAGEVPGIYSYRPGPPGMIETAAWQYSSLIIVNNSVRY